MEQQKQQQQQQNRKNDSSANTRKSPNKKYATPMIVERFSKIPMVSFAVTVGFSQYDKLKSSNVTVGDVMTRAESWAVFLWQKVQPYVEKFQEPISKADHLACNTLDYVEEKLNTFEKASEYAKGMIAKPTEMIRKRVAA